jgi:hypothetical protein
LSTRNNQSDTVASAPHASNAEENTMTRNLKRLGLSVVASVALSMAATSVVQASELHAATGPNASFFGSQTNQLVFSLDSGTVKCAQVVFEGTGASQTVGTTTSQAGSTTAQYTGCFAFGLGATIDMNGCETTSTGEGQPALTSAGDIICNKTVGKVIEVTAAGGCTITVGPQTLGGHATYTNVAGSPAHVLANITVTNIKYEGHGVCPSLPTTTPTTGGTVSGVVTIQAREDKGAAQATHNGHTYQKLLQTGALVALTAT